VAWEGERVSGRRDGGARGGARGEKAGSKSRDGRRDPGYTGEDDRQDAGRRNTRKQARLGEGRAEAGVR